MRPEPPFLIVWQGQSFWVETRPPEECSATLQAFRDGCFDEAWCYDATGGGWPILGAALKRPPSFVHRVLPWTRVVVELRLGSRIDAGVAEVVSKLAEVLHSNNEFCELLGVPPAEVLSRFQGARTPADIIQIARSHE